MTFLLKKSELFFKKDLIFLSESDTMILVIYYAKPLIRCHFSQQNKEVEN